MQQSKVVEVIIRFLAAFSEAIIAYMVYVFINYSWFYSIAGIGLITTAAVALGSVCFCFLVSSKRVPNRIRHFVIGAAGLAIAAAVIMVDGLSGLGMLASLVLLVLVWLRGVYYANVDCKSIYSLNQFGFGMLVLFAMNFLVYILLDIREFSLIISQCSILYAVIGIFVLTKCKELQFCNLECKKKNSRADIVTSGSLLTIIILLSSQKVMKWSLHWFYMAGSFIFEALYQVMLFIGYNAFRLVKALIGLIKYHGISSSQPQISVGGVDKFSTFAQTSWVELLTKVFVCLVIAAVIMLILAYIRRVLGASANNSTEVEYAEDREFIVGTESIGDKLKKGLKGIVSIVESVNNFKRSDKELVRNEYKKLLKILSKRHIIVGNETAESIESELAAKYPHAKLEIEEITRIYERVRYGGVEPMKEEVKLVSAHIHFVKSVISE